MKIEHDGDRWCGSFRLALETLLNDILSDGAPVAVAMTMTDGTGNYEVAGQIERFIQDEAIVLMTNGTWHDVGEIISLEVE